MSEFRNLRKVSIGNLKVGRHFENSTGLSDEMPPILTSPSPVAEVTTIAKARETRRRGFAG